MPADTSGREIASSITRVLVHPLIPVYDLAKTVFKSIGPFVSHRTLVPAFDLNMLFSFASSNSMNKNLLQQHGRQNISMGTRFALSL
ncbi:hypothetical protein DXT95_22705 [Agrobacterium tumefaciens]|nr:hypothetical protein [Agrobacterium tumefaciens]